MTRSIFSAAFLLLNLCDAHAQPKTVSYEAKPTVTASVRDIYKPRSFQPTLKVSVTPAGSSRVEVIVEDKVAAKTYDCKLAGTRRGDTIELDPAIPCKVGASTQDFSILTMDRCDAGLPITVAQANDHLDKLVGSVRPGGKIDLQGGRATFDLELVVSGCLVAFGHNKDVPIEIGGGTLTLTEKAR